MRRAIVCNGLLQELAVALDDLFKGQRAQILPGCSQAFFDQRRLAQGFDRSYYLRDQGRFFNPKVHWEDDKKLPPVKPDTGFYGTDAIADHAVKCLKEHAEKHAGQPFFHYLAFTAPHFPLHAPAEDIERYRAIVKDLGLRR